MEIKDSQITQIYRQEEVQQILQIAMMRREENGEITKMQLMEIASELGISPDDLEAAELEWSSRQGGSEQEQEKLVFQAERLGKLKRSLAKYGIVNFFLLLLSFVISNSISFGLPIAIIWGIFVALQTWDTLQTEGESYEKSFQKWRLKKQLGKSISNFATKLLNG